MQLSAPLCCSACKATICTTLQDCQRSHDTVLVITTCLCCQSALVRIESVAGCKPQDAVSALTNLKQLWTELKDGLALKMLAGLRQSAGLSPPLGLLALPAELKTKILSALQV